MQRFVGYGSLHPNVLSLMLVLCVVSFGFAGIVLLSLFGKPQLRH